EAVTDMQIVEVQLEVVIRCGTFIHCRQAPMRGNFLAHASGCDCAYEAAGIYTVTTTFPICWFDSRYRWASTISLKANVFAITGLSWPEARPSMTNFLPRSSRAGSEVISKRR